MSGFRVGYVYCIILVCLSLAVYYAHTFSFAYEIPTVAIGATKEDYESTTILFVGDLFLGRRVETYIEENGDDYPFVGTASLLHAAEYVVANFESAVPEVHVKTPDLTYQFSVQARYLAVLQRHNIGILSFANNHVFDYGANGYEYAVEACALYKLTCKGHPDTEDEQSTLVVTAGDSAIGIIFLEAVQSSLSYEAVKNALEQLKEKTREQVAFIHWGTEYELTHNDEQKHIAQFLIDEGVDAVIGHHPHVVQDIELYNGKPIFYSLGNFIFDQYFDQNVEEGLAVRMTIERDTISYTLIPLTSRLTRSQPRIMTLTERDTMLDRVLSTDDLLPEGIERQNTIVVQR